MTKWLTIVVSSNRDQIIMLYRDPHHSLDYPAGSGGDAIVLDWTLDRTLNIQYSPVLLIQDICYGEMFDHATSSTSDPDGGCCFSKKLFSTMYRSASNSLFFSSLISLDRSYIGKDCKKGKKLDGIRVGS